MEKSCSDSSNHYLTICNIIKNTDLGLSKEQFTNLQYHKKHGPRSLESTIYHRLTEQ